jgi:hypothetical protein
MPRILAPINNSDDAIDKQYADNLITTANLATPVRAIESYHQIIIRNISGSLQIPLPKFPRQVTIVRVADLYISQGMGSAGFTLEYGNDVTFTPITGLNNLDTLTEPVDDYLASVNNVISSANRIRVSINSITDPPIDISFRLDYKE